MQIRESKDYLNFKMLCGMGPWPYLSTVHEKPRWQTFSPEGIETRYTQVTRPQKKQIFKELSKWQNIPGDIKQVIL